MNYPLLILEQQLHEIDKAKAHCLSSGNEEDYNLIIETKENPIKKAIYILNLSEEYNLFKDEAV